MKPTSLHPGDLIRNRHATTAIVWTFVRRVQARAGRAAYCVLQTDSMNDGTAIASDYSIAHHYERVQA